MDRHTNNPTDDYFNNSNTNLTNQQQNDTISIYKSLAYINNLTENIQHIRVLKNTNIKLGLLNRK